MKELVGKKRKDGWIEAWFSIEALAINEDVVRTALKDHIEKLSKVRDVVIFEKVVKDALKVHKPLKNVEEAYSQVVDLKLMLKDLYTLIVVVLTYGPSSVEVISPGSVSVKAGEMQSISNLLATLIHQFASAGVGGIVITPKK